MRHAALCPWTTGNARLYGGYWRGAELHSLPVTMWHAANLILFNHVCHIGAAILGPQFFSTSLRTLRASHVETNDKMCFIFWDTWQTEGRLRVCVCVCVCDGCVGVCKRFTIFVSTRSHHKNSKPTKILRSEDILPLLKRLLDLRVSFRVRVRITG